MPPQYRLTRSTLAAIAALPRRRAVGRFFSLSAIMMQIGAAPRATVVVSKKICPKAAARNLLRRRCRAALQDLLPALQEPIALVFSARTGAAQASYQEISRDLATLLKEAARH